MPTTDMNPPSKFERFLSSPLCWSNVDIESQQSQQSIIHSFQDPSPQMHHSTDHSRDQSSSQHDSIENRDSPSSYAVEDYDIQGPNAQSFAHNSRQSLFNTPIQRPRSTSNSELQFSIPNSFTQEENNPRSQSGNQNPYFNNFIYQRRHEDHEIDLEGQYPRLRNHRKHLEYDINNRFADRYRRTSDTYDQNPISYFEHRANESQNPYSNTQDPHQNANPEPTSALKRRPRRRSHPGNGSPPAEPLFNPLDYTNDDIESQRFRAPGSPKTYYGRTLSRPSYNGQDSSIYTGASEFDRSAMLQSSIWNSQTENDIYNHTPPAIPADLDFFGIIQTLRRPVDYFRANKEEMKEIWQCVPNEDLEEGMLGCYAWNHEDKDVCVSCRGVRGREARSRLVALKRALGFKG